MSKVSVAKLIIFSLIVMLQISTARSASGNDYDSSLHVIAMDIINILEKTNNPSSTVLDFTDIKGNTNELGRFIAQSLSDKLVEFHSNVLFVDRGNLKILIQELKLTKECLLNPNNIAKIWNLAGINTVIVGTVVVLSSKISLSVRVINVETGKIITAETGLFPLTSDFKDMLNKNLEDHDEDGIDSNKNKGTNNNNYGNKIIRKQGWFIDLHTITLDQTNRKINTDEGSIYSYIQEDSNFSEGEFLQKAGMSLSDQPLFGIIKSKFIAQKSGQYQIILNIDMMPGGQVIIGRPMCWVSVSFNKKKIINNWVRSVVWRYGFKLKLNPGAYDTNLEFGCLGIAGNFMMPLRQGRMSILVTHPGESSPTPALPDDFSQPDDLSQ